MQQALERLQALAAVGSGWVSILASELDPEAEPGVIDESDEFAPLRRLQAAYRLAERGSPGEALDSLDQVGALSQGLASVRQEIEAQLHRDSTPLPAQIHVENLPLGPEQAPTQAPAMVTSRIAGDVVPPRLPQEQPFPHSADEPREKSMDLRSWLTRVQAWRKALDV